MLFSIPLFSALIPIASYFTYILPTNTPIINYITPLELTEKNSGLAKIDCIYVINLDHRIDRWERTKRLFNNQGCYPNRVSAVNGWALTPFDREQLVGPYNTDLKYGAIGCLLSHVNIHKDAHDRGFNTIWICEDDIEIVDSLSKIPKLITELTSLDPNWDLLYTDYTIHGTADQQHRPGQPTHDISTGTPVKRSKNLLKIHGRYKTHSMIFSKKGINKVLNYFTHVYLWKPIDVDIHYVPSIREYSVKIDIVTDQKVVDFSDTEMNNP